MLCACDGTALFHAGLAELADAAASKAATHWVYGFESRARHGGGDMNDEIDSKQLEAENAALERIEAAVREYVAIREGDDLVAGWAVAVATLPMEGTDQGIVIADPPQQLKALTTGLFAQAKQIALDDLSPFQDDEFTQ